MHQSAPPADTLLLNGYIHTVDDLVPVAEALAIRDGRILALGSSAEMREWAGAHTRIIDLEGRMVMPGLVDAHCHPAKGAIADLFSCKFEFSASDTDIAGNVAAFIAANPDAPCVIGGRWGSDFFTRHPMASPRGWLDEHARGRPVYLRDDSGHNGWANSAALTLLGIDRTTPDPKGGTIVRDPTTGEPTGLLLEEADSQARNRLPDWTPAQYLAGVRAMVRLANGYGITGVTDADASEQLLQAYQAADEAGDLKLYVATAISTPYGHRTSPLDYAHLEHLRDRYRSLHVDTRFVKIYEDGVPTSARSAAMLTPYLPDGRFPADYLGVLHVDEATLTRDLIELELRGFTVKLHTAGDRSIRVALNAIAAAHAASGSQQLRHELSHAGFIAPEDLPRFQALNAVADLSPYLWHPSPIMNSIVSALGARAAHYWPIRDLLESGAPLLAGSDWPAAVPSMDPWIGIEAMVTRRDPTGRTPGAHWPEQAISLAQALRIFTLEGARALRRETITGSLSQGKSADLIVLSQRLFEIEPDDIAATTVELTLFAGEIVYRPAASGLSVS